MSDLELKDCLQKLVQLHKKHFGLDGAWDKELTKAEALLKKEPAECNITSKNLRVGVDVDYSHGQVHVVVLHCKNEIPEVIHSESHPVLIQLEPYDSGYLNNYGGGNVNWWHDYIRSELERAYEHYQMQLL